MFRRFCTRLVGSGGGAVLMLGTAFSPALAHVYAQVPAAATVFDQARAAARNLHGDLSPVVLLRIAFDEEMGARLAAQVDVDAAFAAAGDPLPAGPRPSGIAQAGPDFAFRWLADEWVEHEGILLTLRLSGRDHALALARRARSPHGALYDQIISYRADRLPATIRFEARADSPIPAARIITLAMECRAADGTFPYDAAASALDKAAEGDWRIPLARLGLSAVPAETDPQAIRSAATFLLVGNRTLPQLSQEFEDAASDLLVRLNQLARARRTPRLAASAVRLMNVLGQLDPDRAQRIKAEMPWASEPTVPSASGPGQPVAVSSLNGDFSSKIATADPEETLNAALGLPDPSRRFAILVRFGLAIAETRPDLAREAADALPELRPAEIGDSMRPAANLAVVMYRKLADRTNALALINECLDAAAVQAEAAESDLANSAPSALAYRESGWLRTAATEPWVSTYGIAAEIEPGRAMASAAAAAPLYAPLALSQVARTLSEKQ